MVGPVGSFGVNELTAVPVIPDNAPNAAESTTMTLSLFVHCRAATAGAISMALINSSMFIFKGENPRLWANSLSNVNNLNSFQNITSNTIRTRPHTDMMITSFLRSADACPKIKRFKPAWLELGIF